MAAATTGPPKTSPQRPKGLFVGDDDRGAFVAGGDEWKKRLAASASKGM
jgi:hypothetical protein